MMEQRLKNRDKLLSDLARQLELLYKTNKGRTVLGCVEVRLTASTGTYEFGLPYALTVLAEDLFYDERGDWSDADKLDVYTI